MITQLQAKNFKCWQDTGKLHFAPLTGLFGTNSSGKTSIIQILLMLKQTVETTDRKRVLHLGDERSLTDLGTFYDVVHNHQSDQSIKIRLSWSVPEALEIVDPAKEKHATLFQVNDLSFETCISEHNNRLLVDSFRYFFGSQQFGMEHKGDITGKETYDLTHGQYPATRTKGRAWPLPPPIKCYGFPDQVKAYYQNMGFASDLALAFEDLFTNLSYLGPLRVYPQRSYVWAGERPPDVGTRGERAVPALLAARAEKLTSPRKAVTRKRHVLIEKRIAEWLQEAGMIHSFTLRSIAKGRKDYELRVKKTARSSEVLITDVGFGVSQILPVVVLCYYMPPHSTIILEQPEIHLHPSVQAALADAFIDVVNERNVQIIVESHSEHFLRRLQRRIAEQKIPEKMTSLYFCRVENGVSRIERLDVDMLGQIRNWPKDFFGDEMGELVAITKAAASRSQTSPR